MGNSDGGNRAFADLSGSQYGNALALRSTEILLLPSMGLHAQDVTRPKRWVEMSWVIDATGFSGY
jgi:hypothetical protein